MKFNYSLRFKFILIFIISILIPVSVIMFIFPYYYKNQIVNETNKLMNSNLSSIGDNISQYLNELQNIINIPCFDKDVMAALEFKNNNQYNNSNANKEKSINTILVSSLPDYLKVARQDILSTIILTEDGSAFYSNRNENVELIRSYRFSDQIWYKEILENDGVTVYIGAHEPDYFTYSKTTRVFSVARVIKHPYIQKALAVIIADGDTAVFKNMIDGLKLDSDSIGILLDNKGGVLYSTNPISDYKLKQINLDSDFIKENGVSYSVIKRNIVPSYWKIIVLMSDKQMKSRIRFMYIIGIIFALTAMVITFIIFCLLSKRILNSFEDIISVMKQVERGNLDVKCFPKSHDEMATLEVALNNMIVKLNDLITKEYRLVLEQRNAEYKALQSQIQPHFLYNTLTGFIGLNRIGAHKTLEKSILNLTGMLRYTLEYEEKTTIEHEFEFLEKYCELQKLRFEDRMNVTMYFDKEIKDFKIPKLLLQPMVENCVIYGVEPLDRKCNINIEATKVYEDMIPFVFIRIDDDGNGFDNDKLTNRKSIGISNVKDRLKIAYVNSSFFIKSSPMCGTNILIKIQIEEGGSK